MLASPGADPPPAILEAIGQICAGNRLAEVVIGSGSKVISVKQHTN